MQAALLPAFNAHLAQSPLSKREIARRAGVRPEMLSRLATQKACDTGTLEKLAAALGLEIVFQPKGAAAMPSKTQRLKLSLPLDWSNPNISDIALIRKSLEYANLADLTRLALEFGIERLETEVKNMPATLTRAALQVLPNVRKALASR
jgi:transcriptional regulator with XRE-family HTH domain